jgi:hypothetical protein
VSWGGDLYIDSAWRPTKEIADLSGLAVPDAQRLLRDALRRGSTESRRAARSRVWRRKERLP